MRRRDLLRAIGGAVAGAIAGPVIGGTLTLEGEVTAGGYDWRDAFREWAHTVKAASWQQRYCVHPSQWRDIVAAGVGDNATMRRAGSDVILTESVDGATWSARFDAITGSDNE